MLVLSRKEWEVIRVGNEIEITVVRIANGNVRLGIKAPPEMAIVRGELPPLEETHGGDDAPQQPQDAVGSAPAA